ncbi:hypothetical protein EWE75_11265 [Sphingomonas populi]|uniref:PLD phosphodiesterase domain-containing protein n=1 Tax=Sphingomonas populi TaxID=2484750 RepID=A0A4Q6XWJ6_9SPHN|nr:hypothetical protein [Sphingomonas populi]RZF64331.1 hypothetical protein EWE75_11265 [Sphingomonas populi]
MKLPERLGRSWGRGFHSAFATSFALEFAAFEEVMLPQLSTAGATNVLLIADGRMATMALSDGSALPEALGREYVLHSPPVADGVFHPKIVLQVGRAGGRCFVSSANVTGAGLGGNVEVAVEIECGVEPGAEREIVQAAWRYVEALVPADAGAAREAIVWARDRAPWLDGAGGGGGPHILEDGTAIAFLARPGVEGIGARFVRMIGGEAVERMLIASPYWDEGLEAVVDLERALEPGRTTILLDVERHEFPTDAPMPSHREIVDISGWQASRFKHAKVVVAVTEEHDHVLSGSANCTVAALGREGFAGTNAEACVYRRLPRGTATAALGMDGWLEADPIALSDLPDPVETTPIPLDEMHLGGAGAFEAEGGRFNWRRPPGRWGDGAVTLTNASGEVIAEVEVGAFAVEGDRLTTWVGEPPLEDAAFARVRSDAGESLRGYVVHRSVLRARRREFVGGSVSKALAAFDDAGEMQLKMLQAFDELARADVEDEVSGDGPARGGPRAKPVESTAAPKVGFMTYEEFMAARPAREGRGGRSDSTVAGTHFDSVRALLNRLSGVEQKEAGGGVPRDDGSWMDLGDESGELGDAVEEAEAEEAVAPRVRPAPDMSAYDRAVRTFVEGLAAEGRAIGSRDVLRLRLWIALVLWEARCAAAPNGMPAAADDKGWPRLIVRIVSGFFVGRSSPVGRLVVSSEYDDMPVDFYECWSTILWALDAIVASVPDQPRTREFRRRIPALRARVVAALGLTPEELQGEPMSTQRLGLDVEFGTRLGLSSGAGAA